MVDISKQTLNWVHAQIIFRQSQHIAIMNTNPMPYLTRIGVQPIPMR